MRHPILTPLTKLPWDKFVSAAGACDLLFNCKYSTRQVEDEVREEHRRFATVGGYGDVVHHHNLLGNGDVRGEEEDRADNRVGREEGYVNLSLGHEEEEEEQQQQQCGCDHHYGERGCDADEFAELGLDCCSMLDHCSDDEVEVVASSSLLRHQRPGEEGHWERAAHDERTERGDCEDEVQTTSPPDPSPAVMTDDQKAAMSWKSSNPSLDMMLYRTMLNE